MRRILFIIILLTASIAAFSDNDRNSNLPELQLNGTSSVFDPPAERTLIADQGDENKVNTPEKAEKNTFLTLDNPFFFGIVLVFSVVAFFALLIFIVKVLTERSQDRFTAAGGLKRKPGDSGYGAYGGFGGVGGFGIGFGNSHGTSYGNLYGGACGRW